MKIYKNRVERVSVASIKAFKKLIKSYSKVTEEGLKGCDEKDHPFSDLFPSSTCSLCDAAYYSVFVDCTQCVYSVTSNTKVAACVCMNTVNGVYLDTLNHASSHKYILRILHYKIKYMKALLSKVIKVKNSMK